MSRGLGRTQRLLLGVLALCEADQVDTHQLLIALDADGLERDQPHLTRTLSTLEVRGLVRLHWAAGSRRWDVCHWGGGEKRRYLDQVTITAAGKNYIEAVMERDAGFKALVEERFELASTWSMARQAQARVRGRQKLREMLELETDPERRTTIITALAMG